jgi:hypothetical protein
MVETSSPRPSSQHAKWNTDTVEEFDTTTPMYRMYMNHKNGIFTMKVKGTCIQALLQGCVRQARLPIGSLAH